MSVGSLADLGDADPDATTAGARPDRTSDIDATKLQPVPARRATSRSGDSTFAAVAETGPSRIPGGTIVRHSVTTKSPRSWAEEAWA